MVQIDKVVRSRRKTLSVSVNALGQVTLRAPIRTTEAQIQRFLQEHEDWIVRTKQRKLASGIQLPPEYLHGYTFLLLGQPYTIVLYNGTLVRVDEPNKQLYLPQNGTKNRLIGWLKENALRICQRVVERKEQEMGVKVSSVSITSAKSFWGICTAKNDIRFSYRLMYAPKEVIEYVVVHELCHIKHKNHSSAFWREVERYMPDYPSRRMSLRQKSLLLEIF